MSEQATGHPLEAVPQAEDAIPLLWFVALLLRGRRVLLAATAVGIGLALAVALLRPRTYTSTFAFLPQTGQEQATAGLASLVGQFGIPLSLVGGGLSQSPDLYAALLMTRDVLEPIAADSVIPRGDRGPGLPLSEYLGVRGDTPSAVLERTMRVLRERVIRTRIAKTTTGMVTVAVRTRSPWVSAQIARRLLEGLNHFNNVTRQSQAHQERVFTEGRLAEAKASLRGAEDSLQRFLQRNREFSTPELTFEQDRLQRSVTFQQQVVSSLAQQYEQDRIREVRDTPVITVIEQPAYPVFPDPRLRILILSLGTVAGLSVGVLLAMARDAWMRERAGGSPTLATLVMEWRRLRGKAAA